jgi:hypothetical protein
VRKKGDLLAVLVLVATWALVVALVGTGGDFPLNDDWAYAYSARHLLHTGELRILDWAAPSLATHALWGAGALRLGGDSHVALRCGTLVWALSALLLLYGLARTLFEPRIAVLVPLALGLSPWFVNLSFTYMTDVPWLCLTLASLLAFVHALHPGSSEPPRPGLLLLSGAFIGTAALTRQLSLITTPAFAIVLCLDARRRHGARWLWPAARSTVLLGLPAAALFLPFQLWYTRVHGATQANRETLGRIGEVPAWRVIVHVISILHYAGLWLSPLALAALARRRLGEIVTRRQGLWALVPLGGYAVARPLVGALSGLRADHPSDMLHPLMPYMGNVFYLVGTGPPTITGVYWGQAPLPHSGTWLGVLLTMASTLGTVAGAGLLVTALRRARGAWAGSGDEDARREMLRVLLLGFAGTYLLWHLATAPFIFDRYLLPLLPVVLLLGLDGAPPHLARSPLILACVALGGAFSVAATHEYLSWNDARDRAVRALVAQGIPAEDIDGGFEVNGPLHFEAYRKRTGQLRDDTSFWLTDAPYRISFWPSRTPDCTTLARYPYWTWPGGGERAMYALHCALPAAAPVSESGGR